MKKPCLNNLLPEHRTKIFLNQWQIVILTLCNLNAWRIDYFEARYSLLPNSKIFFHNNLLNNVLQIFTDLF